MERGVLTENGPFDRVREKFPDALDHLCDKRKFAWPSGWVDQFGRHNFFHLAGFRKYIQADKWLGKSEELRAELLKFVSQAPKVFAEGKVVHKPGWVKFAYHSAKQDIDFPETGRRLGFGNLSIDRVDALALDNPIGFGKAVLTLAAIALREEANGRSWDLARDFEIRMACHYLPDFGAVYEQMNLKEKIGLRTYTLQINPIALDDLALGYPVTHPLAERVSAYTASHTSVGADLGELAIETYSNTQEIWNGKGDVGHQQTGKRVARRERCFPAGTAS